MKFYETLYIAHPILETGRLKDTIENVQKLIEKNESNKILCTEVWGKKKLAYPIDKQKYGTYILVQYSGNGQMISKVNVELEHNVNILAYMTIEIKETDVHQQSNDIESQILGNVKKDQDSSGRIQQEDVKGIKTRSEGVKEEPVSKGTESEEKAVEEVKEDPVSEGTESEEKTVEEVKEEPVSEGTESEEEVVQEASENKEMKE